MHISSTRFLEVGPLNAKYNSEERLYKGCTNANWVKKSEIKKAMVANDNKDDNKEDP